jgi:Flp pilus assembly protein TadG
MSGRYHERGSTLVETAIVLAVTLTLLFGIIDFSRLLFSYETLANAAREGARWAIVRGATCAQSGESGEAACPATAAEIASYVQTQSLAQFMTNPSSIVVTTTWQNETGCTTFTNSTTAAGPGCQVTLNAAYTFKFLLPFLPKLTVPISSTSTMIVSQ